MPPLFTSSVAIRPAANPKILTSLVLSRVSKAATRMFFRVSVGIVQCKDCPWYKSCTTPMRLTAEDLRRQLEASAGGLPGMPHPGDTASIQGLLGGMASAAQNSMLEGCPVFIQRLRSNQELARRIKQLMQNWGREEPADDSKPIELPPVE